MLQFVANALPGEAPATLGVAVSGGSDSMALLSLALRVQAHRGGVVCAVTVDHGLRPEAADEARSVAAFCRSIGVEHDTLRWDHGEIEGNLQDQARRARYRLIADWAQREAIGHVVLGHTADDQAETFLMGLAREAGIDGLSGMRKAWVQNGTHYSRPLLGVTRTKLRDYLNRQNIDWIEDPSNVDERFTRVKARRVLKTLKSLEITVEKLSGVAVNLGLARQAVVESTGEAAKKVAKTSAGEVVLDRAAFQRLGHEVSRRILISALRWVSSSEYAPRADAVLRVRHAIKEGRDATLSGCKIKVGDADVRIAREPRAVAGLEAPTDQIWDGRWRLMGRHDPRLTVRALGAEGLRRCPDWSRTGHSRAALIVSPAIWRGDALVAAPVAGLDNGWAAEIVAGYHSFLISH
ncbi:tRNA lysidine(34) synthetase TilS [Albidovulum aquaemixtae]|uniref:tRNA lysidine(34) synthetase TilS n=1 Tax=Albidovulum aquaemixtae TaxID=1542388 RepID=UPI002481FE49|nr:tRNA lysidine(34) synthetase TilS [Defluviimonas aquaemixtae]